MCGLADLATRDRDFATARSLHDQSLAIRKRLGDPWTIALSLESLAELAALQRQRGRALRLAGAAARLRASAGAPPPPVNQQRLQSWLPSAHLALTESARTAAWAEGQAMSIEQAVAYALEHIETSRSKKVAADSNRPGYLLTQRELEVATLIAQGHSNRDIADALVIAVSTAERHVANILSGLGLRSRTEIALWAVEHGLNVSSAASRE
jgi:non-specific serine/threonine protein kinase